MIEAEGGRRFLLQKPRFKIDVTVISDSGLSSASSDAAAQSEKRFRPVT